MKKIMLTIAGIVVLGVALLALVSPQRLFEILGPRVGNIARIEAKADGQELREKVSLVIRNSLIPVHIDSLLLKIELEGQQVLKSNRQEDLHINAFSKDTLEFEATVQYKKIYHILNRASERGKDSLQITADGTLFYQVPWLGDVEIPFSREMDVRRPRLPEITLAGVNVEEVHMPEVTIRSRLEVVNHESVELTLSRLDYEVRIDGDMVVAEGYSDRNILIKANDTTEVDVPVKVSLADVDDTIVQFIEEGTDWPVEIFSQVRLQTNMDWFNVLVMDIQMQDTIDVVE